MYLVIVVDVARAGCTYILVVVGRARVDDIDISPASCVFVVDEIFELEILHFSGEEGRRLGTTDANTCVGGLTPAG